MMRDTSTLKSVNISNYNKKKRFSVLAVVEMHDDGCVEKIKMFNKKILGFSFLTHKEMRVFFINLSFDVSLFLYVKENILCH